MKHCKEVLFETDRHLRFVQASKTWNYKRILHFDMDVLISLAKLFGVIFLNLDEGLNLCPDDLVVDVLQSLYTIHDAPPHMSWKFEKIVSTSKISHIITWFIWSTISYIRVNVLNFFLSTFRSSHEIDSIQNRIKKKQESRHPTHLEQAGKTSSHDLVAHVKSEVEVFRCAYDGVYQLHAGRLRTKHLQEQYKYFKMTLLVKMLGVIQQ